MATYCLKIGETKGAMVFPYLHFSCPLNLVIPSKQFSLQANSVDLEETNGYIFLGQLNRYHNLKREIERHKF